MENVHLKNNWESVLQDSAFKASSNEEFTSPCTVNRKNVFARTLLKDSVAVENLLRDIHEQIDQRCQQLQDLASCLQRCHLFLAKATQFYRSRKYQRALQAVSDAICSVPEVHCQDVLLLSRSSPAHHHHGNKASRAATKDDDQDGLYVDFRRDQMTSLRKKLIACYSLRAHLLFKLKHFELSKNDATKAVLLGASPQHLVALKYFIGHYHSVAGSMEDAVECFIRSLKLMESGVQELPKVLEGSVNREEIEKAHEQAIHCVTLPFQNEISEPSPPLLPKIDKNNDIAFGSRLVTVKHSKEKGRFLEAEDKIKAGDALIVERPYASVLLQEYHDTNCYHCLKPAIAAIPCNTCCDVRFCSDECRKEALTKYHECECQLWPLLQCVGPAAHLALRILLNTDSQTIFDVIAQSSSSSRSESLAGFSGSKYLGDYRSVFHLVTNAELQPQDALASSSLTASLMAMVIKQERPLGKLLNNSSASLQPSLMPNLSVERNVNSLAEAFASLSSHAESLSNASCLPRTQSEKSFSQWQRPVQPSQLSRSSSVSCLTKESRFEHTPSMLNQDLLADLLLHHLQQLSCNIHSITRLVAMELNEDDDEVEHEASEVGRSPSPIVRKDLKCIAVAVYPTASLLNHSCDPDVIVSFIGEAMVVRATHNLAPGEEITHCYGPHVGQMMRSARQTLLRKNYFFTCLCGACKRDEAKERQQLCQLAVKCSSCGASSKVCDKDGVAFTGTCLDPSCGLTADVSEQLELFLQSQDLYAEAVETIKLGNVKKSLGMLQEVLKRREALLASDDRSLAEVHDALAKCFAVLGDWVLASYHCTLSTESVERRCGKTSPELALELLKLAQFLFRGRFVQKCIAVAERGIKLLSMHFGRSCPAVTELLKIRHSLVKKLSSTVSQFSL